MHKFQGKPRTASFAVNISTTATACCPVKQFSFSWDFSKSQIIQPPFFYSVFCLDEMSSMVPLNTFYFSFFLYLSLWCTKAVNRHASRSFPNVLELIFQANFVCISFCTLHCCISVGLCSFRMYVSYINDLQCSSIDESLLWKSL
jgi:hypothetical protein